MKEIISSLWITISSMLGVPSEHSEQSYKPQQEQVQANTQESTETRTKESESSEKDIKEEKQIKTQGEVPYQSPKDAPWLKPVEGSDIISETAKKGKDGTVSTIVGNGTDEIEGPRKVQLDSKKNIWFVDGDHQNARLRKWDGKEVKTVIDLVHNKTTDGDGYFFTAGLAIIHDNVYISSTKELYMLENNTLQPVSRQIRQYLEEHNMENIYRVREYKDKVYMMLGGKGKKFMIISFDPVTKGIKQVTEPKPYASPYNFYVHNDNEIMIATELGYVVWEKLHPRQTQYIDFGDAQIKIADTWVDDNRNLYMVTWEEQTRSFIYKDEPGKGWDNMQVVAGGRRGFVDGFKEEVEMDQPIDFVWDGSGYIFADIGNNSIRKLWWKEKPSEVE